MANEEQLALLKHGVGIWNAWRKENPNIEIDLSCTNLHRADLSFANLYKANLQETNLCEADIHKANLSFANLYKADLRKTDLSESNLSAADLSKTKLIAANLIAANLSVAKLYKANLHKAELIATVLQSANLHKANLHEANLSEAKLRRANLNFVNLNGAKLREADLSEADLRKANLHKANLHKAKLNGTYLIAANLYKANFRETNLQAAKLSFANLFGANLYASQVLYADFTQANLTGACIAHCPIGDSTILNGVKCDYIFRAISPNGEFIERRPHNPDRIFEPGEFAKLVKIHENTVELIFRKGINWSAFAHAFNETNTKIIDASGQELYLKKYEVLDDGLICLEVTVPPGSDKQAIHDDLERDYEQQIARLEGVVQAQDKMLEQVLRMLKPGDIYMNSSKYDQRGAQFAGGFAETVNGNQIGGIINNYGQNTDDILRLLTSLRDLSQSFPDEQKEKAQMALDGLEADLNKPEKPSPKRLGQWLKMLILAGTAAATFVEGAATFSGNVNEFTDNTFKLVETLGLSREDVQPTP